MKKEISRTQQKISLHHAVGHVTIISTGQRAPGKEERSMTADRTDREGKGTLLLTAFEPFGGAERNAALDAVLRQPECIDDLRIVKLTVPTVFGASVQTVMEKLEKLRPDAVLMVGQAAGRAALTPEAYAVNRIHARIPDNAGNRPQEQPVVPGGPARRSATLPAEELAKAIRAAGVPSAVSEDAGTFVCNELFYGVLQALSETKPPVPAGFLHVSLSDEQAHGDQPSLPPEEIAAGLEAAVRAIGRFLKTD